MSRQSAKPAIAGCPVRPPQTSSETKGRIGGEGFRHLRCIGRPVFRTTAALDLALVLDLEPTVLDWWCLPDPVMVVDGGGSVASHLPDFEVSRLDGSRFLLDAARSSGSSPVDPSIEYRHAIEDGMLAETFVRNARGIMACAYVSVTLADQVRLLALLEYAGAVPLSRAVDGMAMAREPVAALMALAAHRIVRLDWKTAVVGPRTCVERFRAARPTTFPRSRDVSKCGRRR